MLGDVGKELPEGAELEGFVDNPRFGAIIFLGLLILWRVKCGHSCGTSSNRNMLILSASCRAMSQPSLRHVTCLDWHSTDTGIWALQR